MNVQPINLNTTRNCNNPKVSFKGYRSSITRDALTSALKKVQPNGQTDKIVDDWWRILEEMQKAFFADRFVDVTTYIEGEDIWARVALSKGRILDDFVDKQVSQSITLAPQGMKNSVDRYASEAKIALTNGLRAV